MLITEFINKLSDYKSTRFLSKEDKIWLSKIFQFYSKLNFNEGLFFKYLKIKLKQIPQKILNHINFTSGEEIIENLWKDINHLQRSYSINDIEFNEEVYSELICAISENFNIQVGMYSLNEKNNFIVKADLSNTNNMYNNKWLIEGKEMSYVLEQTKKNSGIVKKSKINSQILESINNKTNNTFHLFVRKNNKKGSTYSYFGVYKAVTYYEDNKTIKLIKKEIQDIQEDLKEIIEANLDLFRLNVFNEKFRMVEQKQRLGQKLFRDLVIAKSINKQCALCNIGPEKHLIANHIKPFAKCSNEEAVDPFNGILLCPDHNYLMDKGFLSFSDNGQILISKALELKLFEDFRIEKLLDHKIKFDTQTLKYINFHRKFVFEKSGIK